MERTADRLDPTKLRVSAWAGRSKLEVARLEDGDDDDGDWVYEAD